MHSDPFVLFTITYTKQVLEGQVVYSCSLPDQVSDFLILACSHSFTSFGCICIHRDLDLSSYEKAPDQPECIYDLFAVINHYGGMGSGHCE